MKKIKKLLIPMLAAFLFIFACAAMAACGGDEGDNSSSSDSVSKYAKEDDATNWDYTTYVVYLLLPDGSPVADVSVQICSGTNCLNGTSNEDGRVSVAFSASQKDETVYLHFPDTVTSEGFVSYEGPDGYTYPAGSQEYTTSTSTYSHAWFLTAKVTTLTFTAK